MFRPVAALFQKILRPTTAKPTAARAAEIRRRLFHPCPGCGKILEGHGWWVLATVVLREPPTAIERLADLIEGRKWEQAAEVREWEGGKDEREYYVVRCPTTTELSLVTVLSRAEMWADDCVEAKTLLGDSDSKRLTVLVDDRWEPF